MWTEQDIQVLLTDATPERLDLEYKAAPALADKKEIRKDVSAMANSAGGTIIYGLKEKKDAAGLNNIPDGLDDVTTTQVTKETLERVINEIKPRVSGIRISGLTVNNCLLYLVEVPESTTAHMADDKRYYRRYNFEVRPMEEYEVRQTINRSTHPVFEVEFYYTNVPGLVQQPATCFHPGERFVARIKHIGGPLADKVAMNIDVPEYWIRGTNTRESREHLRFNTFDRESKQWMPLFPAQQLEFSCSLPDNFWGERGGSHAGEKIRYTLWADSAFPVEGEVDASNTSPQMRHVR